MPLTKSSIKLPFISLSATIELKISDEEFTIKAKQFGIDFERGDTKAKLADKIFKKVCRPKIIQPTFIIDYPIDFMPLAKRKEGDERYADVFQFIAGGIELVKAYSELNDPFDQEERFKEQETMRKKGDKEAQPMDLDFIEALEYGMPPAGGVGIGIDRLCMLFTDTKNLFLFG